MAASDDRRCSDHILEIELLGRAASHTVRVLVGVSPDMIQPASHGDPDSDSVTQACTSLPERLSSSSLTWRWPCHHDGASGQSIVQVIQDSKLEHHASLRVPVFIISDMPVTVGTVIFHNLPLR